MCCRLEITPLDADAANAILATGGFRYGPVPAPLYEEGVENCWQRPIPEERGAVIGLITKTSLWLRLTPPIYVYGDHAGRRIAAGVYFEIAAKYAEKVGGAVSQIATVLPCRPAPNLTTALIANYPLLPLSYERVCPGFRAVILGQSLEEAE